MTEQTIGIGDNTRISKKDQSFKRPTKKFTDEIFTVIKVAAVVTKVRWMKLTFISNRTHLVHD